MENGEWRIGNLVVIAIAKAVISMMLPGVWCVTLRDAAGEINNWKHRLRKESY